MARRSGLPLPLTPIRRILYPFERFLQIEASGGILLLAAAVVALIWANLPHGAESYQNLWDTHAGVTVGGFTLNLSLAHWINDSLMGVFFFVVGLEIKREIMVGELRQPRQAVLPIAAAVGGMIVPAAIYLAFNAGGPGNDGWGIPMATDIAFTIGVMALVGASAPMPLKIFITALAIADDLGAVLVIALFYTGSLNWTALLVAILLWLIMIILNWLGVRAPGVYLAVGTLLWITLLDSGLHATLAGVLGALAIPAHRQIDGQQFLARIRHYLRHFEAAGETGPSILPNPDQQNALEGMETVLGAAQSPMARLEHAMLPWVMYLVMPLFALANAGVTLVATDAGGPHLSLGAMLLQPVSLGVAIGLFLGKPIGILAVCWLVVRTGLGAMPRDVGWGTLIGGASLAGIGFTMSLFIANLGLDSAILLAEAKVGFLAGSLASGIAGSLILSFAGARHGRSRGPSGPYADRPTGS